MKKGPITGTFIDDVTYDIPSSNWTLGEWRNDLDNMKEIGIDTVIFINEENKLLGISEVKEEYLKTWKNFNLSIVN